MRLQLVRYSLFVRSACPPVHMRVLLRGQILMNEQFQSRCNTELFDGQKSEVRKTITTKFWICYLIVESLICYSPSASWFISDKDNLSAFIRATLFWKFHALYRAASLTTERSCLILDWFGFFLRPMTSMDRQE